jgi:RNA polymerase sigma-70 factor (ECF subfamily)
MSAEFSIRVLAYEPRLYRFALTLCRDGPAAQDLTQETMAHAIVRAHLFTPGTKLGSWLCMMLLNLFRNELRSQKTRPTHAVAFDERVLAVPALDRPDIALEVRQCGELLRGLKKAQREVILLTCVRGQSYKAAAETLGIPIGAVMSRVARAREELKRQWHGTHIGEPGHVGHLRARERGRAA